MNSQFLLLLLSFSFLISTSAHAQSQACQMPREVTAIVISQTGIGQEAFQVLEDGYHRNLSFRTASGEKFDASSLTVAHKNLPFGTELKLVNLETKQSIRVTVNDRGPYMKDADLALTPMAYLALGASETTNSLQVEMENLSCR